MTLQLRLSIYLSFSLMPTQRRETASTVPITCMTLMTDVQAEQMVEMARRTTNACPCFRRSYRKKRINLTRIIRIPAIASLVIVCGCVSERPRMLDATRAHKRHSTHRPYGIDGPMPRRSLVLITHCRIPDGEQVVASQCLHRFDHVRQTRRADAVAGLTS
jgi:hypothetical protein